MRDGMTGANSGPPTLAVLSTKESLGDAFFKLPVARALRRAYPDHRISWIVSDTTRYSDALARFITDYIDELIPEAGIERPVGAAIRRLRALPRYSLAFDLRTSVKRVMLARLFLRHDAMVSGMPGYLLSDRRPPRGFRRPRHWQARMLALVEIASGRPADGAGPLPLLPAAAARAADLLPAGRRHVGIVAGASGDWKTWPLDRFVELASRLAAQGAVPVFLIGPAELDHVERLRQAVPAAIFPDCEPAAGRFADHEVLLALGRRLDVAVANDTGLGHLLAAAGTPLVCLFGPTDPARWAPVAERVQVIRAQEFGSERLSAIPVDAVAGAVAALMAEGGERGQGS